MSIRSNTCIRPPGTAMTFDELSRHVGPMDPADWRSQLFAYQRTWESMVRHASTMCRLLHPGRQHPAFFYEAMLEPSTRCILYVTIGRN